MTYRSSPPHSNFPIMSSSSSHYLALKVLKKFKRPMTVKEITKEVKKKRKISGKTPENSISSLLQRSACTRKTKSGWVLTRDPDQYFSY